LAQSFEQRNKNKKERKKGKWDLGGDTMALDLDR